MQSLVDQSRQANFTPVERLLFGLAGGTLLGFSLVRRSKAVIPVALGAGYLLYRGLSGKDPVNQAVDLVQHRRTEHAGIRVERALTVNRSIPEVYQFWRRFENFPDFMMHLEKVKITGEQTSHWEARGPLGMKVSWDAEIIKDLPNEFIAWRTLPGSEVEHTGQVSFVNAPGGRGTEVHVALSYNPPGGRAAVPLASLFGENPAQQIREDLNRFKQVIEAGEAATVMGQTSGREKVVEYERELVRLRKHIDVVQTASEDSFPASDAPGWTAWLHN